MASSNSHENTAFFGIDIIGLKHACESSEIFDEIDLRLHREFNSQSPLDFLCELLCWVVEESSWIIRKLRSWVEHVFNLPRW